ncbi:MAG: ferric reductase-like transmembrane domain-containing protein [Candidatus Micrarchaeota archaeon]|nr:ferric reductase-like transmembrane domain-containing protein [Candidatus Micrarchaeota archaeon]
MSKTFLVFSSIFILIIFSLIFFSTLPFSFTKAAIKFLGIIGFFLLSLSLILGPLAVLWPNMFLKYLEFRKTIGVAAFLFVAGHLYLTMQNYFGWNFSKAVAAPGVLPGILGFFILTILAITSFDKIASFLGSKVWKFIHYFNYVAFILSFIHFVLKSAGPAQIFGFNYLEFIAILFGVLAIFLQLAGFFIRITKKSS